MGYEPVAEIRLRLNPNHLRSSNETLSHDAVDTNDFEIPLTSKEALFHAVNTKDFELAKYVLAHKLYGKQNLIQIIDSIFENFTLSNEIYSFIDWPNLTKNDFCTTLNSTITDKHKMNCNRKDKVPILFYAI